jgi:hypothetical protein
MLEPAVFPLVGKVALVFDPPLFIPSRHGSPPWLELSLSASLKDSGVGGLAPHHGEVRGGETFKGGGPSRSL